MFKMYFIIIESCVFSDLSLHGHHTCGEIELLSALRLFCFVIGKQRF